jgi:hypothetical protein
MLAYQYAAPKWTDINQSLRILEAIKGLKFGKAPGPNGIPNRVLRHLPKRVITFLTEVFNAVLRRQYFRPEYKHAHVVPVLKPGKDPTLPSSYRPMSLFGTVGKALLNRVFREVNEHRLLRDEQFGFRPRHSTILQLARLVERVKRNFDERRLTGAGFLDVAKAFDSVWIKGLIYRLTVLNSPSYLVRDILLYFDCRKFHTSLHSATSTRRHAGCSGPGRTRLPVVSSPCVTTNTFLPATSS